MSPSDSVAPRSPVERSGILGVLRAPAAVRLLVASLVGRLPLGAAPLALLVYARETMPLGAAAVLVGCYTAGTAAGAPVLARLADRWRQPPVMWLAVSISTAGFALSTTRSGLGLAATGALIAGAGAPPFEACLRVLWRSILPEPLIRTAYSLDIAAQEMIFVVGPVVTVAAVAVSGPAAGLAVTAGAQLIGTAWFTTASAVRRWRGEPAPRHWAGPLRSGGLRVLLLAIAFVGFAVGSIIVAATAYAEARTGASAAAGWLLAAQAGGALVGGIGYARIPVRDERASLPWIAGALAAGYLILLTTPGPPVMAFLMAVSGLALPALLTAAFVTVDSLAPTGTAAEAFAWVATSFTIASAAGSALDGLLIERAHSVTASFALAPAAALLAAVTLTQRAPRRPSPEPPTLAP